MWDIRKKLFAQQAMRHWHRLSRDALDAPSLEMLKARLDRALGSLSWWGAAHGRGWGWVIYRVPTNIGHPMSVICEQCWRKRFLGFCAITPPHVSQHALLDPAAPGSTNLSVKRGRGKCVGRSTVPTKVPFKCWDPCLCGSSGALGVHSFLPTRK